MRSTFIVLTIIVLAGCSYRPANHEGSDLLPITKEEKRKELIDLANKQYEDDNYSNALIILDTLIKLYPNNGELFYKKAYSESKTMDLKSSTKDFLRAAELGHRKAEAYYCAGLNQIMIDNDSTSIIKDPDYHTAIEFFMKCLESNPDKETEKMAREFIRACSKQTKASS